jgi:hypothetical protein
MTATAIEVKEAAKTKGDAKGKTEEKKAEAKTK